MLKISDNEFDRLVKFMRDNYGINLSHKRTLIEGRLGNMLIERGFKSYDEYLDCCLSDKSGQELDGLLIKLTTNHTYFMREPEHYSFLMSTVLPFAKKVNESNKSMHIWSAGCSSGEEAYTTAMHINEYLGKDKTFWDTRILATDISLKTLAGAQNGIYQTSGLSDLPPGWVDKYFDRINEEKCKIKPSLRKEVIFRTFNLMEPIPYKKAQFDLIFCRNVMIYFEMDTKIALVKRFFDVLRPGGYLFIGHAESIPREATKYEYIKPAIYRKPLK